MKSLKYIVLLLMSTLFLVACSDDEKINSGNATVAMTQTEMKVKETTGVFQVPISVTGEQNAPIKLTVEVAEYGENPAMDDVHYMVTSKTLIIQPENPQVNLEIKAVDDDVINKDRTFVAKIVQAQGAAISVENDATIITFSDNDANFYEKFAGKWKFFANNGTVSYDVNIQVYDEDDPLYEKEMIVTGLMGYDWTTLTLTYNYDLETGKGSLNIPGGTTFAKGVGFADPIGEADIIVATVSSTGMSLGGELVGTWSDDLKTITFEPEKGLAGAIFTGGSYSGYIWFKFENGLKMEKQQ